MADETARLAVLIEANTKAYERAMTRLENRTGIATRRSARSVSKLDATVRQLSASAAIARLKFAKMAGGLGLAFGGGALIGEMRQAITDVANLGHAADRVGVSAEALQVFRKAIEEIGGSADQADTLLEKLQLRAGQVAYTGAGPAADSFKALGVAVTGAEGRLRPTEAILRETMDALASVDDQGRQAALAYTLFEEQASKAITVLAGGSQILDTTEARMRSLGQVMSNEAAEGAKTIDDRFNDIADTLGTNFRSNVVGAATWVYDLIDSFRALDKQTNLQQLNDRLTALADQRNALYDDLADNREFEAKVPQGYLDHYGSQTERIQREIDRVEADMNTANNRLLELQKAHERPDLGKLPAFLPTLPADDPPAKTRAIKVLDAQAEALQRNVDAMDNFRAVSSDTLSGFVQDLREGMTAASALEKVVDQMTARFLDQAVNGVLGQLLGQTGTPGGGWLQQFASSFFHGGGIVGGLRGRRAHGGPVSARSPYLVGERGPEIFVPSVAGKVAAVGGGGVTINVMEGRGTRTEVSRDDDGTINIESFVDDIVARKIGQRGSASNRALGTRGRMIGR